VTSWRKPVAVIALALSLWPIATVYVNLAGPVVEGNVTGKREAFSFSTRATIPGGISSR